MATALKRTVYTRSAGSGGIASGTADPALQRFLDAVWSERGLVGEHACGLSRRPDGARPLARGARQRAAQSHAHRTTRLHRGACRGRLAAPLHGAAAVELPPLFPLHDARGPDHRRPDGADRDAEDRPLAAEVADRRRGRVAARGADRGRSAGTPRPHHARGPVCHRPAGFGAREPQAQSGQLESRRDARASARATANA